MLSAGEGAGAPPINWRDVLLLSTNRTEAPPYADLRRYQRSVNGFRGRDVKSTTDDDTLRHSYALLTRHNPHPRRVRHFKGQYSTPLRYARQRYVAERSAAYFVGINARSAACSDKCV